MHGLIDSVPFKAVPYLEIAWVCAPNAAGQAITANTITTLTMDSIVQNTAGGVGEVFENVTVGSNQVQNLPTGQYCFEARSPFKNQGAGNTAGVLALYNVSDSSNISRGGSNWNALGNGGGELGLKSQFKISSAKFLELRLWLAAASGVLTIENSVHAVTVSLSTAEADQRTTLKLWKVA